MQTKISNQAIVDLSKKTNGSSDTAAFAQHVAEGLSQNPKKLSSRYFYDATGSKLFQKIMDLPEYYLTRCEFEVLNDNRQAMANHFAQDSFFHLIDLGAGDALKTKILLKALQNQQSDFDYVPIDISGDAISHLHQNLDFEFPNIKSNAVIGEYFQALEWLQQNKSERKVVLFLGSNIGNFDATESLSFLHSIRSYLTAGDKLLLGVDLRKDPYTILKAYDDASGVTAAFNLNLLKRINEELGGNFDLYKFRHYPLYNPQEGVMKSFLLSERKQEVYLEALDRTFSFEAWEAIHTENSYKYSLPQVEEMGRRCGFKIETVFQDKRQFFADVLFSVD
ncbi:L-histidine N(alpha)-methyltransferase [Pontibacter harenae]|uniref:L-histidine N(alpha)-methyltransferase n=1 Tax=Pontibacter harenae TaxID=2894083 RepID=UPI001E385E18|nr:L-histidine N(alpha)-methyltransferase [Pontibacter harenae]MCC9165558.1 L-histidine N(alpha)-methyltransferase [Pontibacter harenae]